MSSLNFRTSSFTERNAAGTPVRAISKEAQLTRMTLAHMLWENQFYVDGQTSADTLKTLVAGCKPEFVQELAKLARSKFKLRHVPLLLMRELARKNAMRGSDLAEVIQRPDEMGEFLAMYKQDSKAISNQVKVGLAMAFKKFNEYQLAKWDKNSAAFSLRDVMFLSHPKPDNEAQEALFKRVANQELVTPDTWETQLSAGTDKKETFTRLMSENKLGALAFLRNLRNMKEAGVSSSAIRAYGLAVNVDRVLPFRFIAAARIVPEFEDMLEAMMFRALANFPKLKGKTKLYVDVSSSMYGPKVSAKSDITRQDASLALAMLCREICEEVEIYSFSGQALRIAPRRGFALAEAIKDSQTCSGTEMFSSLQQTASKCDRVISITDEQTYDTSVTPKSLGADRGYILNVGSYVNGVNHAVWLTITGFSESVLDYIRENEEQ
jgi:lambda repressor-like predicted transcriptional regulator